MANKKHLSLRQIFESENPNGDRINDLFSTSKVSESGTHLCIFEDQNPIELPNIVVPSNNDLETFFADVATYFPSYVPISAYMHIVDRTTFEKSYGKSRSPNERINNRRDLSIYIGLILGDALSTQQATNQRGGVPSYSSCRRTLTYCVARSALLYPSLATQDVSDRWVRIRELSGMDKSTNAVSSITWIADLISGNFSRALNDETGEFIESLYQYFKHSSKRLRVAEGLISLYPSLHGRVSLENQVYEKRIESFNAVVNAVRNGSRGSGMDSMCVAFFCNLILPGSLAHSGLVERLLVEMPDCMLWYGLFAGTSEEFSLTTAAGGVGQKLLRDLVVPFDFLHRPTCDISFDEYEVLSRVPLRSEIVKPTQTKAVLVSLYPGVEVYVRSAMEGDEGDDRSIRTNLLTEQNERVLQARRLLAQADQILDWEGASPTPSRSRAKTTTKVRSTKGRI